MTFKQLVAAIAEIRSEEKRLEVFGEIDRSFCRDKITFKDHEILYDIASRVTI